MQRVHTAYGPGTIVAEETVHGRTQYRVEGEGFAVWAFGTDLVWDEQEHEVDRSNSTTLPYNPRPQHPSDVFRGNDVDLGPGTGLDPHRRLTPSDSLSFEDRDGRDHPGPSADLFAGPRGGNDTYRTDGDVWPDAVLSSTASIWDVPPASDKHARVDRPIDVDSPQAQLDRDPILFAQLKAAEWHQDAPDPEHNAAVYLGLLETDAELRTAAWKDVRAKAVRLRRESALDVMAANHQAIYGQVQGDHGRYETIVVRAGALTGSAAISEWSCTCKWGQWAFKREMTYVGRLCSHAYAMYLELQGLARRKNTNGTPFAAGRHEAEAGAPTSPADDTGAADYGMEPTGPNDMPENAYDPSVQAARHPSPDGTLSTERGTLDFTTTHIPFDPERYRDSVDGDTGPIAWGSAIGVHAALEDIESVADPADDALLRQLRALVDEGDRPQENVARNRELQALIRELRHRGYNADNLTAALTVQASGGPFDTGSAPASRQRHEWSSSEDYVRAHEGPFVDVERPGHNPVEGETPRDFATAATRDELKQLPKGIQDLGYLADYYDEESKAVDRATHATVEGDHELRQANLADIQSWASADDTSADALRQGGGGAPVTADDPALAMFTPPTRTAAEDTQTGPAWLLGNDSGGDSGGFDFAAAAQERMRTAGRQYSTAEQQLLVEEASADGAPVPRSELDLRGTHYLP